MKIASIIAFVLVIIGALNWLLIGIFDVNIVGLLFGYGEAAVVSRIIYGVVGLAGLYMIFYIWAYRPFAKV